MVSVRGSGALVMSFGIGDHICMLIDRTMVSVQFIAYGIPQDSSDSRANERRFYIFANSVADNCAGTTANNKTANFSFAGVRIGQ